jgi:hypothetical protein
VKKFVRRRAVYGPSIKTLSSNVERYAGSNPSLVKRAGSVFGDMMPPIKNEIQMIFLLVRRFISSHED